jgi:hypothetical protein
MDLPPEYVLHLLPLMVICGIPPPQTQSSSPGEKRPPERSFSSDPGSLRHAPTLASIPYIDQDLGRAILKLIDQWRTLALWEPFASKERQVPGVSLEGMFRVIPVDRVCLTRGRLLIDRVFDYLLRKRDLQVIQDWRKTRKLIPHCHLLLLILLCILMES